MRARPLGAWTRAGSGVSGWIVLLALAVAVVGGCNGDSSPTGPKLGTVAPDFAIRDVNPNSPRYDQMVSPRDYLGRVSAWYFGHATWGYCQSQFGFLDTIQGELDGDSLAVPVSILGINPAGYESGNAGMTAGRVLPWLQETAQQDAWGDWGVTYRDVVILDSLNVIVDVYNLTEHDLSSAGNRETLKQKLRDAGAK
jgi:hypothetical protein